MSIYKLALDLANLPGVVGPGLTLRWMTQVLVHAADVYKERNLQPADRAMGNGPFSVMVKPYSRTFYVSGPQVFSGIREMYARDVYLRRGLLSIEPGDIVLDLGANMGNFTCLSLAAHPDTRVIAIEPSRSLHDALIASVGLNPGFIERVRVVRAFVGGFEAKQQTALQTQAEDYGDAALLTERELLQLAGERIDFLKCDIEGSEFDLLKPGSRLLQATRKLACEVHAFAGDVEKFMGGVAMSGFRILHVKRDADGTATFLAKRR